MTLLTPLDDITEPAYDGTADNGAKKRGRPAGARSTTPRAPRASAADKKNVDTALASMATLYNSASMGLMLSGRVQTASLLVDRIEALQVTNRQAFEASPKLAAAISSAGQFSAIGMFIASNIAVLGAVAMSARVEGAQMKEQAAQNNAQQAGNTSL